MALATRCPHCHTTFRVAHDQLKLRAGIVRCGACKHIFNGIEHLLRPDEAAPSLASHRRAPTVVVPIVSDSSSHPELEQVNTSPSTLTESQPEFTINSLDFDIPIEHQVGDDNQSVSPSETTVHSPLSITDGEFAKAKYQLNDQTVSSTSSTEVEACLPFQVEAQEPNSSDSEYSSKPALALPQNMGIESDPHEVSVSEVAGDEEPSVVDEPGFIKKWRRQQRTGKMQRILMGFASSILLMGLFAQGTYTFRKQIAVWFPTMEPVLTQMCIKIGCQLHLPAQITAVSIESSELQTLSASKNEFTLTLLLANHSQLTQAWPSIELTLNDANEQPVARRIFAPSEYLASLPSASKGIPANSEQPVKLFFELTQLKASGYRVYLFYS